MDKKTHLAPAPSHSSIIFVVLRLDRRLPTSNPIHVVARHDGHCKEQYDGEDVYEQEGYLRNMVIPIILRRHYRQTVRLNFKRRGKESGVLRTIPTRIKHGSSRTTSIRMRLR